MDRHSERLGPTCATSVTPGNANRLVGLRVVTPAGAHQYTMAPACGKRPMGLTANAVGRPGVRIRGRSVVVTGLPARTGIVDVTVYQPRPPRGPSLLAPARRVSAVATIRAPEKRIVARVTSGGG